jgi:hypothetical protein
MRIAAMGCRCCERDPSAAEDAGNKQGKWTDYGAETHVFSYSRFCM